MEAHRIEAALRDHFAASPPAVVAAWLYGSVARGTARPDSDVDVAVLLGREPARGLAGQPFDLEDELARLLGRDVQVVVLDRAPPDLAHRVLRDGRLLFESDPAARVTFQVRSRNEYFDLLPVLEEYRRTRKGA
jgi:hypothetical protein